MLCLKFFTHQAPGLTEAGDRFVNVAFRVPAGVSMQVELPPGSLHLRQQLRLGRGGRRLRSARKQRCLPRCQATSVQGCL